MASDVSRAAAPNSESPMVKKIHEDAKDNNDKTKLTVDYGYRVFREYCQQKGIENVDHIPTREIARLLQTFYEDARTREGVPFSANSLVVIRYAINRYYRAPHINRNIDIVRDPAFHLANKTFKAIVRRLHQEEKNRVPGQHRVRPNIYSADHKRLRQYFLLNLNTPRGLLQKVWFDLSAHMGYRSLDKIQELGKDAFKVVPSWVDKRRAIYQTNEDGTSVCIMTERPGDPLCPVRNFEAYAARLNPACRALFQRPKDQVASQDLVWYFNAPLGKTLLSKMMATISKCAGLSRVYSNARAWAIASAQSTAKDLAVLPEPNRMQNGTSETWLQNGLLLSQKLGHSGTDAGHQLQTTGLHHFMSGLPAATALGTELRADCGPIAVTGGATGTCLNCGAPATVQVVISRGCPSPFCTLPCYHRWATRVQASSVHEPIPAHSQSLSCNYCGRAMFGQQPLEKGHLKFCSTLCLTHWEEATSHADKTSVSTLDGRTASPGASSNGAGEEMGEEDEKEENGMPDKLCDFCKQRQEMSSHHLVAADNTLRSFCSYDCLQQYERLCNDSAAWPPVPTRPASSPGPAVSLASPECNGTSGEKLLKQMLAVTHSPLEADTCNEQLGQESAPVIRTGKAGRKNPAPQKLVQYRATECSTCGCHGSRATSPSEAFCRPPLAESATQTDLSMME
ncbi:uncharacterized protein LOC135388014 [Ornithodoros turicata]